MPVWLRWIGAAILLAGMVGVPTAYYRAGYAHAKRLREVAPGQVYRSGQLTADGFREAVRRYGIRTIINLQEEARDPFLPEAWQQAAKLRESELCQELGIRYIALDGGVLGPDGPPGYYRPPAIDQFLAILDDPQNYPVLFHCKAGLHRTGLLTAIYRMEYENRPLAEAVEELRANGFGTFAATDANFYVREFLSYYQRGVRPGSKPAPAESAAIAKPAPPPDRIAPVAMSRPAPLEGIE
ncbi:MAG: tyrosine-protein phosphatase [Bacteroidales bacterium]|nr:tyrosine-protein phosphatase [Bacteroidales bacterium]